MALFAWLPKLEKCCFQFPLKVGVIIIIVWLLLMPVYSFSDIIVEFTPGKCQLQSNNITLFLGGTESVMFVVCALLLIVLIIKKSTQISDTVCVLLCILFLIVILHFVILTYWLVTKKDYEKCEMSYLIGYFGVIFMIILMGYIIIIINSYAMEAASD